MKSNRKLISRTLCLVILLAGIGSISALAFGDNSSKHIERILKTIPMSIKYKNQKVGFMLNHFQIIKDFDQKSIKSLTIEYGKGSSLFLAKITVINRKNQKLVYQVSTNPKYYWNRAWGYHGRIFYKLYEYYPKWTYINPMNKFKIRMLKSISYYDAQGKPGTFSNPPHDIFRREFVITKKSLLIEVLKEIDTNMNGNSKGRNSYNYVREIQYNTQRKIIQKKPIKNFDYWHNLAFL